MREERREERKREEERREKEESREEGSVGESPCEGHRHNRQKGRDFTWKRHNDRFTQMCRLDLIFCSDDCLNVSEVCMDPWQWSDHLAVCASIP